MLDQIIGVATFQNRQTVDPRYLPHQAILSSNFHKGEESKLAIIFPPWHNADSFLDRLEKKLLSHGWSVLRYRFHDQIVEANVQRMVESFEFITNRVTYDIEQVKLKNHYDRTKLISMSVGTIPLAMVAGRRQDFTEAVLVVPGHNVAYACWHGIRTQFVRKAAEKQSLSFEDLDKLWLGIAPETHAVGFKGKKVHLLLSSSDRVIPAKSQKQFMQALESAGALVTFQSSKNGHIATIIKAISDPIMTL